VKRQQKLGDELDINCAPPTREEIRTAMKKFKNSKAAGVDTITAEMLKTDIICAIDRLHELFCIIWKQEELTCDWSKGLIIKLPKKGDKTQCTN